MKIESMEDLFVEQVEDLYDAEQRLVKALPKMSKAVSSRELAEAIDVHLDETKEEVERLEQVFSRLGRSAKAKTCEAMKGLIDEAEDVISDIEQPELRDAAIIASCNRMEHYEIAGYGTASAFARTLGRDEIASLLEKTLEEEKRADKKFTALAVRTINNEALRATAVSR
jgi:ferritin-like metal-binding protein YciE